MIIVTGAAGVLGQAVVRHLAEGGAAVAAMDLATEIPGAGQELSLGSIDLNDRNSLRKAVEQASSAGDLTGLVNVAGGFRWERISEGSLDTWDLLYRMNLRSAAAAIDVVLPFMRRAGGAIVNIAAAAGQRGAVGMSAYSATKAGVMRLTESLAAEEMDNGVRVNAILPSIIDTPANRSAMPDEEHDRWVKPEAIAEVVAFLLSKQAAAITGASIPVTGRC